jgi:hypothetical protein
LKRDPDYIQFRPYGSLSTPFKVTRRDADPDQRNRWLYLLLAFAVMGLGLLWRSRWLPLPHFLAKAGGDALWSLMVFLGMAFLRPAAKTPTVAMAALLFSYIIEFTQLYHAPWIDYLRSHRLGELILGSTFNWPDFGSNTVGVLLAVVLDLVLRRGGVGRSQVGM